MVRIIGRSQRGSLFTLHASLLSSSTAGRVLYLKEVLNNTDYLHTLASQLILLQSSDDGTLRRLERESNESKLLLLEKKEPEREHCQLGIEEGYQSISERQLV